MRLSIEEEGRIFVALGARRFLVLCCALAVPFLQSLTSCVMVPGNCLTILGFRGQILDANTGLGLGDIGFALRTIVPDDPRFEGAVRFVILDTTEDGTFDFSFPATIPCGVNPDTGQLRITVERDTCEFQFLIDINDESAVVDSVPFKPDAPDLRVNRITLLDPILVPACEQETSPADESNAANP